MFLNFCYLIFSYLIFFVTIYSYGQIVSKIFFKNLKISFEEYGIFGFIFIYFLVTLIHFFYPINYFISFIFFSIGLSNFIYFCEWKNLIFKKNFNINLLIFLFFILLSITNNHHDDLYIFILPIINYMQDFKVVFGLVNLNDYIGQGHSLYEIMSVFQLPVIGNRAYFLIPVIFFHFFIIFIVENYKNNKSTFVKNFIIFLILIFCLRFNRSKEFGTDLPVLCMIFYVQLNLIKFITSQNTDLFLKSILAVVFAIILKIYSFVSIFYLLVFLIILGKKFYRIFLEKKNFSIFITLIVCLTIGKNIIVSGCAVYPIANLCFDKKNLNWSIGKEISHERNDFYSAQVKGWKSYIRNINEKKFINPNEYINLGTYQHFKALSKDSDFEKILSGLFVTIFFILISIFTKGNKKKLNFSFCKKIIFTIIMIFPFLIWLLVFPQSRYGYYSYISFLLISLVYFFLFTRELSTKFIKVLLTVLLIFVCAKNIKRIINEVKNLDSSEYPIKQFRKSKEKIFFINDVEIKIPKNSNLECANIKMLCASYIDSISEVKIFYNYYFLENNIIGLRKHLKKSAILDMIEMND